MREEDKIHFGLNLTSAMKKSYFHKSEDIFEIDEIRIRTLNVQKNSIGTLNIHALKKVVEYVAEVQCELMKNKQRKVSYKEVRYELMTRKTYNLVRLREKVI